MVDKRADIRKIEEYVKDLEESLIEWDLDIIGMMAQITIVSNVIKEITKTRGEQINKKKSKKLKKLEKKAKKCLEHMMKRLNKLN